MIGGMPNGELGVNMQHVVFNAASHYELQEQLKTFLQTRPDLYQQYALAQCYTTEQSADVLEKFIFQLHHELPKLTLVGGNAMGIVCDTQLLHQSCVLSLMFFEHSQVDVQYYSNLNKSEKQLTDQLAQHLLATQRSTNKPLKGVLLLSTAFNVRISVVLQTLTTAISNVPVFGGIVGNYEEHQASYLFFNDELKQAGIIAVGLYGQDLRVETKPYLGWQPFGEVMTVTSAHGNRVATINHQPAFQIYHYFTGIERENFFDNAVEFPFVLHKGEQYIARVPQSVDGDELLFLAEMEVGDEIQFSYGDVSTILSHRVYARHQLAQFQPEAILVYSCCSRLHLLQEDASSDSRLQIEDRAVAGFFTLGEIDTASSPTKVLNASVVIVALSEQPIDENLRRAALPIDTLQPSRHLKRLKRLMRFVSRTTEKLYQANKELQRLAQIDALTGLNNRRVIEERIPFYIELCQQQHCTLSLVLFDIDHFKQINDKYGHVIGDEVLKRLAEIVSNQLDADVLLARYGGEEFVLLLPNRDVTAATKIAERLRKTIAEESATEQLPSITCSFGVAHYAKTMMHTSQDLIDAADKALYKAKEQGRNKVVVA